MKLNLIIQILAVICIIHYLDYAYDMEMKINKVNAKLEALQNEIKARAKAQLTGDILLTFDTMRITLSDDTDDETNKYTFIIAHEMPERYSNGMYLDPFRMSHFHFDKFDNK